MIKNVTYVLFLDLKLVPSDQLTGYSEMTIRLEMYIFFSEPMLTNLKGNRVNFVHYYTCFNRSQFVTRYVLLLHLL